MTIQDLIQSSAQSLERTRGRSALTMLGIVIGIMSVILMLSIGEAAQRYILSQVSALGSDVLTISNGSKEEQGQPSLFVKESLVMKDVRKLRSLPWIRMMVGVYVQSDRILAYGYDASVNVLGTMPDEVILNDRTLKEGAFFDQSDVDAATRVIVLGYDIADKAFGADSPIGKSVKINNATFRVIGVMTKSGTKAFQNVDAQVYVPVTTALDLYNKHYVSAITVKTALPPSEAKPRLEDVMRDRHDIDNSEGDLGKDDFHISTQEDAIKSASQITQILQILLISIAAISLIVGGIGIMNIMYVAVTERIREIGLRKAIGATRQDILNQFILESVILTTIGGAIGIVLGSSLSWLAVQIISRFQGGWTFAVSTNGVILGLTVSAAIGILFGYFPARRAAILNPIEALRAE